MANDHAYFRLFDGGKKSKKNTRAPVRKVLGKGLDFYEVGMHD